MLFFTLSDNIIAFWLYCFGANAISILYRYTFLHLYVADIYKNSTDLKTKGKFDLDKPNTQNLVRFHMNIGKKNGVGAQHILGLINDKIQKRNIFIGKIDIMKNFLFFEIEHEQESEIIRKLNNIKWRGAHLKVEIAKDFSKEKPSKSKKKRKKLRKKSG